MMHKITYLSQDNTHRTPEITWKTQTWKNHGVTRKSTIIERLQGEEENFTALFSIALTASSLSPNYCASLFIEKTRVTNCEISKLSMTCDLSFLYREASRLDHIRCALGMFLCSIAWRAPLETSSDPQSTWTWHHLKLQARQPSPVVRRYSGS